MTDISPNSTAIHNKALGYVAGLLMIFFAPAGVILAYIDRSKASTLLASHYSYLIGTFWKGLLFGVVSSVLTLVLIGGLLWIATGIWYLIRCIKSLVYLHRDQPIAKPHSWLI
ncbi:hypothetical protein [Aliihoeflea sp. 2WW]|uniref:DUF4870 family protein n=1 Tax=Aliihoeflea sp. 2WW TaxID=1381123 RepID=UPI0004A3400A|nr:hypothetical protein [Aliihoeflea sp. 2WW]